MSARARRSPAAPVLWLASAVLVLGLAAGAPGRAQPSVEIEWSTTGVGPVSNPDVVAQVGDTVTATFYLENPGDSVLIYTVGVDFDATELSLLSATEFLPTGFSDNLTAGTDNRGLCTGLLLEALALPPASPVSGRFALGEAVFEVVAVVDDGTADVTTGPCSGTTDQAIYDGSSVDITSATQFESGGALATPPQVPALRTIERVTLAALLLAVVAIAAAARRSRVGSESP